MPYVFRHRWPLWLGLGLIAGLVIARFWPDTPLHAVATDRVENFAIATGPVDEDVEAIFFLDFLTGTLKAAVLSKDTRTPSFRARYEANINADLAKTIAYLNSTRGGAGAGAKKGRGAGTVGGQIQTPQNPNYLMVTGAISMQADARAARTPPGRCAVYVAETNTGIVMAYIVPWSPQDAAANRPFVSPLVLWTADQFTSAVIRPTRQE